MTNLQFQDIEDIIELLIKADDAYFNTTAPDLMTDGEYDRLKKQAFTLDPSHEYFSRIGSSIRGGKIKLPYQMGSLDQVYEGEIQHWVSKYNLNKKQVIISDKLDGISCMVVYRNGELEIAYSRGNGVEGADITRHVKLIKNIPLKLQEDVYMVIRGELIMKTATFDANWHGKFKNPRGMVAGTMNRSDSIKEQISDIDFVAYEIVATNANPDQTKSNQLARLQNNGFQIVEHTIIQADLLNDDLLTKYLKRVRMVSLYELDGIVITAEEIKQVPGQRNSISLNPEHSCKYKINDESSFVTATVKQVIWEISKSGFLKPRVEIIPVDLFGTTVTYATGFNGKFIKDNQIGTGSTITITKSGTVIPYIVKVLTPAKITDLPDETKFGKWGWNDSGVEIVLDDADNNPQVVFKQVLDFIEKFNVELLKESSLTKVFDAFKLWNRSYSEIVQIILDLKQKEWDQAVGANGVKSFMSLHRRMQNVEFATLLGASKFMGIGFGVRKAKMLLAGTNTDENTVWNLTVADIAAVDGFDVKTAESVVEGLKHSKKFIQDLLDTGYITLIKIVKTAELSNLNIVMTGFRDPELAAEVERRGGKVGSGVSKKTTHLLTFDANSNSGKAQKARELGVKVMTPDEFKDEFNL